MTIEHTYKYMDLFVEHRKTWYILRYCRIFGQNTKLTHVKYEIEIKKINQPGANSETECNRWN